VSWRHSISFHPSYDLVLAEEQGLPDLVMRDRADLGQTILDRFNGTICMS
jgi:hypothetical protein